VLGGLAGFRLTGSVFTENICGQRSEISATTWPTEDFACRQRHPSCDEVARRLPRNGTKWRSRNTIVGGLENFTQTNFPTNTYYTSPATPVANLVVSPSQRLRGDRVNLYIYNWEDLDSVSVDLSSAVASALHLHHERAGLLRGASLERHFPAGPCPLPMAGLTAAAGSAYTAIRPTGRPFNAFIVRAQEQ